MGQKHVEQKAIASESATCSGRISSARGVWGESVAGRWNYHRTLCRITKVWRALLGHKMARQRGHKNELMGANGCQVGCLGTMELTWSEIPVASETALNALRFHLGRWRSVIAAQGQRCFDGKVRMPKDAKGCLGGDEGAMT